MTIDAVLSRLGALQPGEYLFVVGAIYLALVLALLRRWVAAATMSGIGVLWLAFYLPVSDYLKSLSADSFIEAQHFDLDEARFWWLTFSESIYSELSTRKLVLYLAIALSCFALVHLVLRRMAHVPQSACRRLSAFVAMAVMGLAVYTTAAEAVSTFVKNSQGFESAVRNFDQPVPTLAPARNPMELVVYIGESTSVMNMGLYGYPRDTTPRLSALARTDDALLVFRHMFSTHVHTTQSLLEALSFGLDPREDVLPIARRRRFPLPGVLVRAGVDTRLLSNQGLRGAFEEAGSIVFRNSRNTFRMEQDLAARRTGTAVPSRWDDEFFQAELTRERAPGNGAQVTFLHSYAGHGPYLENIPPAFRRPVDNALSQLPGEQILLGNDVLYATLPMSTSLHWAGVQGSRKSRQQAWKEEPDREAFASNVLSAGPCRNESACKSGAGPYTRAQEHTNEALGKSWALPGSQGWICVMKQEAGLQAYIRMLCEDRTAHKPAAACRHATNTKECI